MLRRDLGDDVFKAALRRFYRENRFRKASWDDLRHAFEGESHRDLGAWFDQWIRRPGAIALSLEDVSRAATDGGGSVVRGTLVQQAPAYVASVPVVVEGGPGQRVEVAIAAKDERTSFEVRAPFAARRVAADPGFDLFRLLHDEEVAPALSGVLGADSTQIVLGADATGELGDALRKLADEWAVDSTFTVRDEADADADFAGAVWYFGSGPVSRAFRAQLPPVEPAAGTLVAVGRRGGRPDRMAAVFWPASAEVVAAIGRKTPHYSKYSYLVFDGEKNVAKGAWEPGDSPLVVTFAGTKPEGGSH
jgi:aminopeptidase N